MSFGYRLNQTRLDYAIRQRFDFRMRFSGRASDNSGRRWQQHPPFLVLTLGGRWAMGILVCTPFMNVLD